MDNTKIKTPPLHMGYWHAGKCVEWLPSDTKESFDKLYQDPSHRQYFEAMGWDKPGAITYKFNSHGFRADEFDGGPYLVTLGCSFTVGIGLPDADTWPRKLATRMGLKCANLGWGGYSADTCYRLAEYWIPELKPDYVCMLVPPKARIELLMDNENAYSQVPFDVFLPESRSKVFNSNDLYLKYWFLDKENANINQRKNVRAIKQLCDELNIPVSFLYAEGHMYWDQGDIGYARDYMHAGPKIHERLTEEFLNAYTK